MEQVLDELRPRFIEEIDANSIVFNLKYMGIISERDLMTITQNNDTIWQNQFLFDHVRSKCNEKALMIFCDEVMSVQSNPRMKAFGEDMKRLLAGKHLCVCVCACVCARVCVHAWVHGCVRVCVKALSSPQNSLLV